MSETLTIVPRQPSVLDLCRLVENVAKINHADFTKEITVALAHINRPMWFYKSDALSEQKDDKS